MKDYFTEGSSGVCVCGIGSKQNTGVSKANSASSHIWLKTISSDSLERESRCIDGSIFTSESFIKDNPRYKHSSFLFSF